MLTYVSLLLLQTLSEPPSLPNSKAEELSNWDGNADPERITSCANEHLCRELRLHTCKFGDGNATQD